MRKHLFYTLLLTCGFAACADHTGTSVVTDGPQAPINEPDSRVIEPNGSAGGGSNANNATSGGANGNEGNSGNGGGTQGGSGTGGSGTGGGNGSSAGSAGEGGEGGEGGNGGNPPGGGEGGSPVPEPGTLLLVGTGLAGLAGASLRRRQKKTS